MNELDAAPGGTTTGRFPRRIWLTAVIVLALLTVMMFGDGLFLPGDTVLSDSQTDVALYYGYFQKFGYEELRQGNLPLWNPYLFSGQPYVGSFDTAMLYPLNLAFLVLPLAKAINVDFALHTFLAGLFMLMWTARRGLHPLACFTAGALLMFSGPFFMHIYGGHPTIVRAMAWAPLILTAIDSIFARPSSRWTLVGAAAFAMQLLTGNMQYVFYTGIACGLYVLLCLWKVDSAAGGDSPSVTWPASPEEEPAMCHLPQGRTWNRFLSGLSPNTWFRLRVLVALAGLAIGGIGLAAVQLFTGFDAAFESIRSGRVPYAFAAMFSFPPENLLTFVVPDFFGDMVYCRYWGRCYLWEMQAYIGITGVTLAAYGAILGPRDRRRFSAPLAAILIALALGSHTPLFRVLYDYVPGFGNFRGNSKFIYQATLFLIMLAAIGFDTMVRGRGKPKRVVVALAIGVAVLGASAIAVHTMAREDADVWRSFVYRIVESGEGYFRLESGDVPLIGIFAAKALGLAAARTALLALCFAVVAARPRLVPLLTALAVVEVVMFAFNVRASFPLAFLEEPTIERFYADKLRDDPGARVLQLDNPNHAMWARVHDMWGHDSFVLKRYAEFMAYTQGIPPDRATSYVGFANYHPWYKLLRTKHVLYRDERGLHAKSIEPVLERFHFVHDFRVISDRDTIFSAMASPTFNPMERVILEEPPSIKPETGSASGTAVVVEEDSDHLVLDVDNPQRAILLMTDAYSKGWRARGLAGSVQQHYAVLPADYVLRAIPLERGKHRILLEYAPLGFRIGKWVSGVSLVVFGALLVYLIAASVREKRRTSGTSATPRTAGTGV